MTNITHEQSTSHAFPRWHRLRRQRDFSRVFERRCSVADRRLIVYVDRNDLGITRLGLSVGRRFGRAVQRNRVKRLLREAFRLTRADYSTGYDLICIPRAGVVATRDEYMNSLRKLVRAGVEKLQGRRSTPSRSGRPGRNAHRPLG